MATCTLIDIPEPVKRHPCCICLEEHVPSREWCDLPDSCPLQRFHIRCLLTILKYEARPKNPLSNLPFSPREMNLICTRAQELQLSCPSTKMRDLLREVDLRIREFESLAECLQMPPTLNFISTSHQAIHEFLFRAIEGQIKATFPAIKRAVLQALDRLEKYVFSQSMGYQVRLMFA